MTEIAAYGTWTSPVTTELMTGRTIGLGGLAGDGDTLYWLESRPSEAGRSTLMRWTASGGIAEVTPAPRDVGSRVHEYGGGAYAVRDGRIVFSDKKEGGVWLVEADGAIRSIAAIPGCRYADFAIDTVRSRVIAVREDHRDRPPTDPHSTIVALDLAGLAAPDANEGVILVDGPDFVASPRLKPDGGALAWIEWGHPDMPWDATCLKLAPLDAGGRPGPAIVAAGAEPEAVLQPEWAPDGALLFSSDRSGWWNLDAWRDGVVTALCPVAAEIGGPAWQLGSRYFAVLPDGGAVCAVVENGARYAAAIHDRTLVRLGLGPVSHTPLPFRDGLAAIIVPPDGPTAIVLTDRDGATIRQVLKTAGPAVLAPEDIARSESIDFPIGNEGTGHAFFYAPRNHLFMAPSGELPPLVVLTHGGPTSMSGNGFSLGVQWWTTRGFAVVDVNYRGSSGFGRGYRRLLDGQWGVADVEDCIAAAQYLEWSGRVDPARIAIRGGSAGGFTVLAALTLSRVFKAGASLYGIADLSLLASDTHKFESRYMDRLVGKLPEAADIYRARSPLYRIEALECPVIFFHGLDDKVVPPNQAETMVEAMAERGLPVAYYPFEGEGHGFRKAATQQRVLELELGFYGRVFGFSPPGLGEAVVICNLS